MLKNDFRGDFAEMICGLRDKSGKNRKEFSEFVGISERTLDRWERGEVIPSPEEINRLGNLFDVRITIVSKPLVKGK